MKYKGKHRPKRGGVNCKSRESREDGEYSHDLKEDVSSPFYVEHNNKIERSLLET